MTWQIPWPGLILATITSVVLVALGVDLPIVLVVGLIWVATLWLASARSPEIERQDKHSRFRKGTMREIFEFSGSPLLLTERGKIVVANSRARAVLGAHIVGQDARVALRHPEAISLLASDKGGTATIHGLVRRRDIWRMARQLIGDDLAVIELLDRTAEADVGRAHTDFVANASHELRTPLASIVGYAETLDDEDVDPAMARKFLGTIQREAKRMQGLVSDLMSLSRIEAEKHDAPEQTVELTPLVEQAAREGAGPERIARLEVRLDDQFTVRGDRQQLEQLVRNLVDNAMKYGKEDGPVEVSLTRGKAGQLRLEVADQGEGISPEHLPHLTRRFYRTDPGRSRASGGTGLGLAIVKHIVERHRGRLDIESTPGEGTRVLVRLPESLAGSDEDSAT